MEAAVETGRCLSCGAEVTWLAHERTLRLAPIELAPPPDGKGNIQVDLACGTYRIVPKSRLEVVDRSQLLTNHFARCPHAQEWHRGWAWTGHE